MATRQITECDRCHREIKKGDRVVDVEVHTDNKQANELCDTCHDKLERFLDGQELEVPP